MSAGPVMRRAARARAEEAHHSTRGLQLIRLRNGTHGVRDGSAATAWAMGQPWWSRVVHKRFASGWWLWWLAPEKP
jgi:hypothetical protein